MAHTVLEHIMQVGIVAIIRVRNSDALLEAAAAIQAGGITAIEVTMTTPGALDIVRQVTASGSRDVVFGAGTILDPETARAAILAGAQFIVSPTLNLQTIALCKRYSVPVMPGAYTPTEILTAWEAGADTVKVFPADNLGPKFIKAVKAPLPQIRLLPTGGVNLDNAGDFIRAGADVIGVGGELVSQNLLDARDFETLTQRAAAFKQAVDTARGR
jgi:2-dehydro-3-deoxyphosphogluconate aldolase/(4S)-4-hydroxy-2-oxoglutarate aldolase